MKKRFFALLAALCVFAGCLAGCSAAVEDFEEDERRSEASEKEENKESDLLNGKDNVSEDNQKEENKNNPSEPDQNKPVDPTVPPAPEPIEGNFTVPADGYDGSRVTVRFAHTMGSNLSSVLDYYIAEFNKLYPNIRIEHSNYGGWGDISQRVLSEIISGNQPNIAYCYPDHVASYNKSWSVVTLDELIKSQETVIRADGSTETVGLTQAQILDLKSGGFYNEGMVYGDGLMYTLPLSKSTEVLYYNKTFFEANGLSVPTTWEEMEAVCRTIKQIDPTSIPLGYDSEDNLFINLCEQYGYDYTSATGEHYLFNNDGCKSFARMLNRWYQNGYITTQNLYGAYTSGLFTETDRSISHSYMSIGSSGGAIYNLPYGGAFEVGVAPIPQANPSNPKVISQGPSLCLLKSGPDQETVASWLFMKYLATTPEFQAEFSMTSGYMPVIASAQNHPGYRTWLTTADGYKNIAARVVQVCNTQSDAYFTAPAFPGSDDARTAVGYLLAECMLEKNLDNTIDTIFQDAYDELKYRY